VLRRQASLRHSDGCICDKARDKEALTDGEYRCFQGILQVDERSNYPLPIEKGAFGSEAHRAIRAYRPLTACRISISRRVCMASMREWPQVSRTSCLAQWFRCRGAPVEAIATVASASGLPRFRDAQNSG